ncbi:hypothetical protein L484_011382 [Morus notabilis]|uniref:IgA FC receptor n=1 Tax=Morus notabilis TaxID=981085 RepID=W9R5B9_9ROSA|nr:protein PELPK2 [Morus notabilis]EXB57295.1 hypothetical protein L484_011382 [Morus notabilis]
MAFNHPKSFVMPLLLITNLLILLSYNTTFPAEARHLLQTTLPELPDQPELPELPDQPELPELPDQPELPELPDFSSFPLPELPAGGLPKFEFPPLPFFPNFPNQKLPTLGKDHLPASTEPHSAATIP